MKHVDIYTDGACRGNGRKNTIGGYGIVLITNDYRKEIKKAFNDTTNNIMELSGAVEALKMLKEPCSVTLYSDSAYVVNAVNNKWISNWQKNGWKTSAKGPVKNKKLWEDLILLLKIHDVTFVKVKGHADNLFNNRCDELANEAMDDITMRV